MEVKSSNFIPVHNNFSSGVNAPKTLEPPSESQLSISTKDGEQIKPGWVQSKENKLVVTTLAGGSESELEPLFSGKTRYEIQWISNALVDIRRAIAGGSGSPNLVINENGSYSGETAWQNFKSGAFKSGDQQNEYILLSRDLAGSFGSGEKDINAFTAFAAELSSENLQTFLKTYQDTPVTLTGEAGQVFMDFAAGLSGDNMQNFMIAVHNSPGDLQNIIDIGSKLSKDDLSNYLAAVSSAGEDVSILTGQVDKILNHQQDANSVNLSSYLSAAAKTGTQAIEFIEATKSTSLETTNKIAHFINTELNTENDLNNFVSIINAESAESINTIIDVSSSLGGEDKSNLLDTASRAGGDIGQFVRNLSKFAQSDSARAANDFSNFLKTASKAEENLDILAKMSDQLDLAFTSELSAVDTVNFLDAAKAAGGQLKKLTDIGSNLSGSDRSNFFYAAAQTEEGLDHFVKQTNNLKGDDKSEFLLSSANKDQKDNTQTAYMQGILTTKEYDNFQKSAEMISEEQVDDLVAITGDLKGDSRSSFLKTAALAGDNAGELTSTFTKLSIDEQKDFLDVAKGLGEQNLKKLIKATDNPDENFSDFISLAKELKQSDRSGLEHFLSAAGDASPEDLKGLIDIVNKLEIQQQQRDNIFNVDMRHSFLLVASDAGHNLNGLIDMADKLSSMYQPSIFTDIFGSAEAATDKNLGAFIETYV